MEGDFGSYQTKMLVDTGAAASVITNITDANQRRWPIQAWKQLEGFNGGTSLVPFTKKLKYTIGTMNGYASFGLKNIGEIGILGNDILTKLGIIIDIPNRCLWSRGGDLIPYQISNTCRINAIKFPGEIKLPNWEKDIQCITQRWINVFSTHKLQCGKIKEVIMVTGPDPKPQRQYQYPLQAQASLHQTIKTLADQGVVVPVSSPCNAPLWPVKKADGISWRMTIDYRALNKITPKITPVVAKFPYIMSKIS